MAGLLCRIIPVSNSVDQEFLNSLERLVAILEAPDDSCEGILESLRPRLTLGDVLGAVLNHMASGDYKLHTDIGTRC